MMSMKKPMGVKNPGMRPPAMADRAGRAMPMRGNMGDKMGRAMKKGGMAKSGSSASKRADGVAHKGKTKGKIVKMKYGGKC